MELTVKRGTTLPSGIVIQMVDKVTGDPYDLTGVEIHCQFRKSYDATPVLHATLGEGLIAVDLSTGKWGFEPLLIQLPVANYVFDFQLRWPDDKVMNVVPSQLVVQPVSTLH